MRIQPIELSLCVGIALLAVSGACVPRVFAQTVSAQDTSAQDNVMPAEALPPPTMDDPGVAAPAPATHAKTAQRIVATPSPLPPDSSQPTPAQTDAEQGVRKGAGASARAELTSTDPTPAKPSLTHAAPNSEKELTPAEARLVGERASAEVRTMSNGDRIEEYRNGGQLTRVKVTSAKGPSYEILDSNGDGHIDEKDAPNGVQPVGWTLFKWH